MLAHRLVAGVRALIAPGDRSLRLREFVASYRVVTTNNSYKRAMVFNWDAAKNQAVPVDHSRPAGSSKMTWRR